MNTLRDELEKIIGNGNPSTHPALIANLSNVMPHSIKVLESPIDIQKYTCVMHALNIVEDMEYKALAKDCPNWIYASTEFAQYLIDHNILVYLASPTCDCLVVYLKNTQIKHIGHMWNADLVMSKWGLGYLYEHGLFEVPSSYGTEVDYYLPITREVTIRYFKEFAQFKGWSLKEGSL